ncbi:MAG: alpha/beta hydrolase [Gammaproteobacteria bacterium]|nr:alpha/beta hydrolase [Gammaproteobacteria bacterium]
MKKLTALFLCLFLPTLHAADVSLNHNQLKLNGKLEKSDNWPNDKVVLMVHGTLAHNKMEIMESVQGLLTEQDVSSLAITLGLGLNNRTGFYDCPTPHNHKHTDALDEIGAWMKWLEQQGANQVVLLGHSRGGNQAAWFATEHDSAMISNVVLIAPQTWSMEKARADYQQRYAKDLMPLLDKAKTLVDQGKGNSQLKNTDFVYCKDTTATADAFVSYYSDNPNMDTPYLMTKIKKPLLVFAGSNDKAVENLDKIVPPLAEKYGFQLNVMEGADHYFRDLYADEMVEAIVEFINE